MVDTETQPFFVILRSQVILRCLYKKCHCSPVLSVQEMLLWLEAKQIYVGISSLIQL